MGILKDLIQIARSMEEQNTLIFIEIGIRKINHRISYRRKQKFVIMKRTDLKA
jgi:hypothetical protein